MEEGKASLCEVIDYRLELRIYFYYLQIYEYEKIKSI